MSETKVEHSPLPWEIQGATIIWSPSGRSNVAAVSDPRPPSDSLVGYYEVRPWGDGDDADERFHEACANAELIVRAVNSYDTGQQLIRQLTEALTLARAAAQIRSDLNLKLHGRPTLEPWIEQAEAALTAANARLQGGRVAG